MKTEIFKVIDMTCNHCVKAINDAVNELGGIENINIDLDTKKVSVTYDESIVSLDQIKESILEEDYTIE